MLFQGDSRIYHRLEPEGRHVAGPARAFQDHYFDGTSETLKTYEIDYKVIPAAYFCCNCCEL